jgi:hypothetical protein
VFSNIIPIQIDFEVVYKLKKVKQGTSAARAETKERKGLSAMSERS